MESAGAAQAAWHAGSVGYLFVCGIYDYCDTHTNNIWQEYAAAVAAAYVKCLLVELPLSQAPVSAFLDCCFCFVSNFLFHFS